MEGFLNLMFSYFGDGFSPYISRIHTAYIGEDSSILGTNEMFGDLSIIFSKGKVIGCVAFL